MINELRKNIILYSIEKVIRLFFSYCIRAYILFHYKNQRDLKNIKKIHLLLNGGIGDVLMVLPALHELGSSSYQVKIAVPNHSVQFVNCYQNFEVYSYDTKFKNVKILKEIVEFFDEPDSLFLAFNPRFEHFLIYLLSSCVCSYGFIYNRRILSSIGVDARGQEVNGSKADRYLILVRNIISSGASATEGLTSFTHKRLLQKKNLPKKFIVCAPGKTQLWPAGRWAPEYFAETLNTFCALHEVQVKFIGTESERKDIELVLKLLKNHVDHVNLCGKTSLYDLLGLINEAKIVICNDSGVMHMASVCETPCVSIFSFSDKDEFAWGKYNFPVQNAVLKCQPCTPTKIGMLGDNLAFKCKYNAACDRTVKPYLVLEKMKEFMNE